MARHLLLLGLVCVALFSDAHGKLSPWEKKALKKIRDATVATYAETSFSVESKSTTDTTISMFGFQFSSKTDETRVVDRVVKDDGVDFVGVVHKDESDPFGEGTSYQVSQAEMGGEWWVLREGSSSWVQPGPKDADSSDLTGYKESMEGDANGDELVGALTDDKVKSVKKIDSDVDSYSCYEVVPTRESMLAEVGGDKFGEDLIKSGSASGNACIDSDTGFLATSGLSIQGGGFEMEVEGFSTTVDSIDVTETTTYSKFGESVEFPDVSKSSPSAV